MSEKKDQYILALDQGTTSSRAVLYRGCGETVASHNVELPVQYPKDAWVEQEPLEIWHTQLEAAQAVLDGIPVEQLGAIGISNQRETTIAWDRKSGQPRSAAIVWQCRRSSEICGAWRSQGLAEKVEQKTGLVIDAYFSASKAAWLLQHSDGLLSEVEQGTTVFGTVDSWLLFQLTKDSAKPAFLTEPSNACRTMLFDIDQHCWSADLARAFKLPVNAWADVVPSFGEFARTSLFGGSIPISGVLGDQQASLLGHGCVEKGSAKCTFGTGAFLLLNTADERRHSAHGLISSVAWGIEPREYVIEGSIFVAGSLMQWLRDGLGILDSVEESEELAASVKDSGGLTLVPSFVGLGAPHWDENARGAVFGLTRDTSQAHIVRAGFEGIAHQVADVLEDDNFKGVETLSIDGGMSRNTEFCKILSDVLGKDVEVCDSSELTALGAARAAVFGLGGYESLAEVCRKFMPESSTNRKRYRPSMSTHERGRARERWKMAVSKVKVPSES